MQNNSGEMYFIPNKLYAEYIFIQNNSGEMYFILNNSGQM